MIDRGQQISKCTTSKGCWDLLKIDLITTTKEKLFRKKDKPVGQVTSCTRGGKVNYGIENLWFIICFYWLRLC